METKRTYEAPMAQGLDVKIEKTILSGDPQNTSANRQGYGMADEI